MKKYDYVIVGAGLFGAVFANKVTKKGKKCLVIEKRDHIGGNIYTENIEGINVHKYGAHIFHTSNKKVWDYVNEFADFNNYINSPMAIYKDEIYNLPFNMNTFSKLWNIKTPDEAKKIIEKQVRSANITNPSNLEEQAISLVGKDIYEKLVKGYTAKQWGKKPADLPAFIIKRLPVRFTYNNNYFNDCYQGIPIGGYTSIIEKMFKGCDIKLSCDYFSDREYYNSLGDKLVYTGMIDRFYDNCYGKLEYRSLRFETSTKDIANYQGNAVINYTDIDVPYTRIIEHKHFELDKVNSDKTIITKEYPEKFTSDSEPYYPVNDSKNLEIYEKYKQKADLEKNVIFGGRLGQYKYYDMDKVIEQAFIVADKENGMSLA